MDIYKVKVEERGGVVVYFDTVEHIKIGQVLVVTTKVGDKERVCHFEVVSLDIDKMFYYAKAIEFGNWRSFLPKQSFDFRMLIGEKLHIVDDEDKIQKIRRESTYC